MTLLDRLTKDYDPDLAHGRYAKIFRNCAREENCFCPMVARISPGALPDKISPGAAEWDLLMGWTSHLGCFVHFALEDATAAPARINRAACTLAALRDLHETLTREYVPWSDFLDMQGFFGNCTIYHHDDTATFGAFEDWTPPTDFRPVAWPDREYVLHEDTGRGIARARRIRVPLKPRDLCNGAFGLLPAVNAMEVPGICEPNPLKTIVDGNPTTTTWDTARRFLGTDTALHAADRDSVGTSPVHFDTRNKYAADIGTTRKTLTEWLRGPLHHLREHFPSNVHGCALPAAVDAEIRAYAKRQM